MGNAERREIRVATITVSDTRTAATDTGGARLRELLEEAGFALGAHALVRDEPAELRALIDQLVGDADAIVTTGGTGIAPRDQTYEALAALLEKKLDGFGEAFRRLSWDVLGPRAILSRALAGVYRQRVIIALPGSLGAVELGVTDIVAPVLVHAVALASGRAGQHPAPPPVAL
jgi:molybdenum cofactor biosynthesis protein B